jgi:hypothetical protein
MAALTFCHDCLMTGGHFLCKFYQGPEDKDLENRMKKLFEKVHRCVERGGFGSKRLIIWFCMVGTALCCMGEDLYTARKGWHIKAGRRWMICVDTSDIPRNVLYVFVCICTELAMSRFSK